MSKKDATPKKASLPFWELFKVQGKLALREPTGLVFWDCTPANPVINIWQHTNF